ncbi:fungal-specific transcription factor domain-containing protein [Aspergillus cavernicola]|uniref:Fungal-specific transcription factor domain-containing protein n=1 Tax=Aspergillus cavernicola TaxID=176166 RepID=A0ABR4HPD5_9EURO
MAGSDGRPQSAKKRSYIAYLPPMPWPQSKMLRGCTMSKMRERPKGSRVRIPPARAEGHCLCKRNNNEPPSPGDREETPAPSHPPPVEQEISNPIHEPRRLFQPQFVGESTCLGFSDSILQCLNPRSTLPPASPDRRYVRNPAFARQLQSVAGCKLPERIRTYLLVRVALRFIGQDYHLFLQSDFLQQLDEAYRLGEDLQWDPTWACKLFVVLALGELYSCSTPAPGDASISPVPGTGYFLVAVGLLQDLFEEPSLAQIELMLLFCFYSNALGRVNSAHMYSGMAMRLSTSLGLHRGTSDDASVSSIEAEHRVRLWWTVYVFDRSTCSKLGQPIAIHDDDIDVEMPSSEPFAVGSQTKLGRPEHLVAHIKLARINGLIMRDIYGPSSKAGTGRLVQNVRAILQKLRTWDADVPESLRWNQDGGVLRSVASLQLHFNQCIILTTRPILLYVLKVKNPFANPTGHNDVGDSDPTPISDTTRTLADACISASRTSNAILSQLFIENSLATFGYFDAHHLFSSTLVLIISAIISPNLGDSDAVQTAFQMLMAMRDKGNATAGQYFSRLVQIQWNVSRLFSRAPTTEEATTSSNEASAHVSGHVTSSSSSSPPPPGPMELDNYDWSTFLMPPSFSSNYDDAMPRTTTADPLDSPLLQAFLDHTDVERDEDSVMNVEEMGFVL